MSEVVLSCRDAVLWPWRLWNDQDARKVIIQVFACAVIFTFLFAIASNAVSNLAAIGKDISFNFLWQPASYDISQSLIEYSSRSTHFRAMLVGIINTLLVAVFGIVLATVIGFILGVCRLSKKLDCQ